MVLAVVAMMAVMDVVVALHSPIAILKTSTQALALHYHLGQLAKFVGKLVILLLSFGNVMKALRPLMLLKLFPLVLFKILEILTSTLTMVPLPT